MQQGTVTSVDELLVWRLRRLRGCYGTLERECLTLRARSALLRARAHQAMLHARLVRAAAIHSVTQSPERSPYRAAREPVADAAYSMPVARFSVLVTAFIEEMTALRQGSDVHTDSAHLGRMLRLTAEGRELQRRPAYLTPLWTAAADERRA